MTTARTLRRIGFGTTGAVVDAVVAEGDLTATIESMLNVPFKDDPGAKATPVPNFQFIESDKQPEPDEASSKVLQDRRIELRNWWLRRMVSVEEPVSEKMTFIWHNHFATSDDVVRDAKLMLKQNESIRDLCLGDFRDLAFRMLTDGAMLRWLNGDSNTAKSPNENLAREFMELFALGHGSGYSEADVREGARALTGWVIPNSEVAILDPERHDSKPKTIFGVSGNHDASAFCDIVLHQPDSPRFIANYLWRKLAAGRAPTSDALGLLVSHYGSQRDLKALTHAILCAPELEEERTKIVSEPINWLIGLLRTLKVSLDDAKLNLAVAKYLKLLGQLPFYPPSVGGWPNAQAWLSSSAPALRIEAATMAAQEGDISYIENISRNERIEAVGYLLGIGSWSDQSAKALAAYTQDPALLVVAAANTPEYLTN